AEDLQAYLADRPVRARLPGPLARAWHWYRRRPIVAGLGVLVLLLVLAVAIISGVAAVRLKQADRNLRNQLAESLLAQARAENRSQTAGRRDAALAAIAKAALIGPTLELRNEAIKALSKPDLRL